MDDRHPYFSIIIPTFNRPNQLTTCLRAIEKLRYPFDRFEVIVVDDGSQPPLEKVIDTFQARFNLVYIQQPHSGPSTARNAGAAQAKGRFLVLTDDDCLPSPAWLQALASRLTASPDSAVYGQVVNALPHNPFAAASQLLVDFLKEYHNTDPDDIRFITGNNLALSADHYRSLNGFDVNFPLAGGEDREFCARWRNSGRRFIYDPRAVIFHAHAMNLKSFWQQHFNYGRGAFEFQKKAALHNQSKIHLEPLSFYSRLAAYPFARHRGPSAILILFLFMLSQAATGFGFFWERRLRKRTAANRIANQDFKSFTKDR